MPSNDVTQLLWAWRKGNRAALDELTPLIYDELRRLAGYYLQRERSGHTLQGTALVHEAYMRLVQQDHAQWENRAHFFAVAARMMRRILVDHARNTLAAKRGAGTPKLSLDEALGVAQAESGELVDLDEALRRLSGLDEQQGKVVELRFFAGLSVEETASVLGISTATVKRDWATAKAWLYRELNRGGAASKAAGQEP
jgi:RNA polymerase sigma factor (TIGR02999 family)